MKLLISLILISTSVFAQTFETSMDVPNISKKDAKRPYSISIGKSTGSVSYESKVKSSLGGNVVISDDLQSDQWFLELAYQLSDHSRTKVNIKNTTFNNTQYNDLTDFDLTYEKTQFKNKYAEVNISGGVFQNNNFNILLKGIGAGFERETLTREGVQLGIELKNKITEKFKIIVGTILKQSLNFKSNLKSADFKNASNLEAKIGAVYSLSNTTDIGLIYNNFSEQYSSNSEDYKLSYNTESTQFVVSNRF